MSGYIAENTNICKDCKIGHNVVILGSVQVGTDVCIGHNVVIHEGTIIGNNVYIDDGCIIGKTPRSAASSRRTIPESLSPLQIGDGCIIGANVIAYRGSIIGKRVFIGDLASIREQIEIGDDASIGRLVVIEPMSRIGQRVRVASGTQLTTNMLIEDDVFIGSEVSTTNDNMMGRRTIPFYEGQHIKRGARIGSNSTLLPGVTIGEEAVVSAGTIVSRDVPDGVVVSGTPSRIIGDAQKLDFFLKMRQT